MDDSFVVTNSDHKISIVEPEFSEWSCELFGFGPNGIVVRPLKGQEPNWFWRWTQHICFGNRWKKEIRDE